jgi:hypothetical protein
MKVLTIIPEPIINDNTYGKQNSTELNNKLQV